MEKRLRWGEPAAGLRAAIAIRPAPGKAKSSDLPELYLAVQNVSDAPIRLSDTTAAPDLRELNITIDGKLVAVIGSKDPTGTDVTLKPGEAVFLLMFASSDESKAGHTTGSMFAENLLKETQRTVSAEIRIANAPRGAWTGKLATGETDGEAAAATSLPKGKEARALYKYWQANARTDGKIPGGLVERLGTRVKHLISLNKKGNENNRKLAERFEKLLPRFDASHDWTPSDAVALLDDVSAINDANTIHTGAPLPADLADAPWGRPSPDGLRVACLLEPRAKQYPLGTPLRSRILVHNSGRKTAIFSIPSWQQSRGHAAHDAKGAAVEVSPIDWTTLGLTMVYRLAPGEYCETAAAGIGVGTQNEVKDVLNARVGSFIHANPGDEVRLSPAEVEVSPSSLSTFSSPPKDAADLWEKIITERVQRELPLPSVPAERTQIIRRVTRDLFGDSPTPDETAAFIADKSPRAKDALVNRLVHRPGIAPFMGTLQPGETRFGVLPAEPRLSLATGPGLYTLGDNRQLQIIAKKATIQFLSSDPKAKPPGKPYEIALPGGQGTYAVAWERGAGVLWIKQTGLLRRCDFTDPARVKETTFTETVGREKVPKAILDAMPAVVAVPSSPPASERP
jgi:hypothetical protein